MESVEPVVLNRDSNLKSFHLLYLAQAATILNVLIPICNFLSVGNEGRHLTHPTGSVNSDPRP